MSATNPIQAEVNVLLYFDEEVAGSTVPLVTENWWYNQLFVDTGVPGGTTYKVFLDNWNIWLHCLNAELGDYEYWLSPDDISDAKELYQLFIEQHGGVYNEANQLWEYNQSYYLHDGRYFLADMLIFVTGQNIVNPEIGLSVLMCNAIIIEDTTSVSPMYIRHELSHQFYIIGHCNDVLCCMYRTPAITSLGWCSSCSFTINLHYAKYGIKTNALYIERSGPDGYTIPYGGYDYEFVIGSNVTITAYCMGGTFEEWYITISGWPEYRYENPLVMEMDGQYTTVRAFFTEGTGGGGGGGGGGMEDLPW